MRNYYALFSCNDWKEHSSMSPIGVFNQSELLKVIKRKIKTREFRFKRDVKEIGKLSIREIDTSLVSGYIQPIKLNEAS